MLHMLCNMFQSALAYMPYRRSLFYLTHMVGHFLVATQSPDRPRLDYRERRQNWAFASI
jgi:hypothetical protein